MYLKVEQQVAKRTVNLGHNEMQFFFPLRADFKKSPKTEGTD